MNHVDQHSLELYALGAPEIDGRRTEVARHLEECQGCRVLFLEIREFYQDVHEELGHPVSKGERPSTSLTRSTIKMSRYEDGSSVLRQERTPAWMSRFSYFVRKHPIGSTVGSFGLAAALVLTAVLTYQRENRVPKYYNYNTATGMVEILNRKYQNLWQFKAQSLDWQIDAEHANSQRQTQIYDLDHDGKPEILTTLLTTDADPVPMHALTVLSAEGDHHRRIEFRSEIEYGDRSYSPYFGVGGFVIRENPSTKRTEIFVTTPNIGRSPAAVVRMTTDGDIIGRYWHFGHLLGIYLRDVNGDGETEIVLTGVNDVDDTQSTNYPAIVALDPEKIVGETRSTTAPLFQIPETHAELVYIKFAPSDLDAFYHITGMAENILDEDETTLRVNIRTKYAETDHYSFEYYFNHQLRLLSVKSTDHATTLRKRLEDEGRIPKKNETVVVRNLFEGVQYWTGKMWGGGYTKVTTPSIQ